MPVKKTAAKKVAAKRPAKKPATGGRSSAAKKTTTPAKESSSSRSSQDKKTSDFMAKVVAAIKDGHFDGFLDPLDDAINDRINKHIAEQAKEVKPPSSSREKKVTPAPKRASASKPVKLESGKTYKVGTTLKSLAGAKVKFIRLAVKDTKKAVVEMVTEKPGQPKGKRVQVPASALVPVSSK